MTISAISASGPVADACHAPRRRSSWQFSIIRRKIWSMAEAHLSIKESCAGRRGYGGRSRFRLQSKKIGLALTLNHSAKTDRSKMPSRPYWLRGTHVPT